MEFDPPSGFNDDVVLNLQRTQQTDLDSDGDVDILDRSILINDFDNNICQAIGDVDGNCRVDIFDYNQLISEFGSFNN